MISRTFSNPVARTALHIATIGLLLGFSVVLPVGAQTKYWTQNSSSVDDSWDGGDEDVGTGEDWQDSSEDTEEWEDSWSEGDDSSWEDQEFASSSSMESGSLLVVINPNRVRSRIRECFDRYGGGTSSGGSLAGSLGDGTWEYRMMLREVWADHASWMRMAIIAQFEGGQRGQAEANAQVADVAQRIGDSFRSFYDDGVADRLTDHLQRFSLNGLDYAAARSADEARTIDQQWHDQTEEMATYIASINPVESDDQLRALLHDYHARLKAQADLRRQRRFNDEPTTYDGALEQSRRIADVFASGVVRQFPDRFASGTGTEMRSLYPCVNRAVFAESTWYRPYSSPWSSSWSSPSSSRSSRAPWWSSSSSWDSWDEDSWDSGQSSGDGYDDDGGVPFGASSSQNSQREGVTEGEVVVKIRDNSYEPPIVIAKPGTTVIWQNEDDVSHTVTTKGATGPRSEEILAGGEVRFTFDDVGVYEYTCTFHPDMLGRVEVVE